MVNYINLKSSLIDKVNAKGIEITNKSGLNSLARVIKLTDLVLVVMRASNIPEDKLEDVMMCSAPNLAKAWHDYASDSKAIVDRYLRSLEKQGQDEDAGGERRESEDERKGEGAPDDTGGQDGGQGEGKGEDQGQGQGEGQGDGQQGQGQGDSQGEGQGDGEGEGDGEGGQEESDGEGQSDGDGQGGAPIPPEDMPDDPDYIPPSVWNKVVAIIKWNMAHPGKQKNIMLVGPRGIGKTEMCFQLAKKFYSEFGNGVPYTITSPQADHKLTGYGDAMGHEVKSQFSDGYTRQCLILIEEMDRAEPSPLIAINMATANKFMDVPIRGMIQQNPLCTIMATANTAGTGATAEYNTANQLDASTRDRWVYVLMEWETPIALQIAKGDLALVKGLEDWNHACELNGYISATASYRALTDIHDLMDMGFSYKEALKSGMIKYALPKSDMATIIDALESKNTKFARTMKEIMEALPEVEAIMA